jgi:hypothetical protein
MNLRIAFEGSGDLPRPTTDHAFAMLALRDLMHQSEELIKIPIHFVQAIKKRAEFMESVS